MRWLSGFLIGGVLIAQSGYEKDIAAAFAQARKQKKPLWIMVSATWCGPCKVVEQKVLPDPQFQELVRRDFIPLKVYAASGAESTPGGDSLAGVYAVNAYPTFLCVEPTGEVFFRRSGVPVQAFFGGENEAVKAFAAQLEEAKKARRELPELRRRFQKGDRSVEFLRSYLAKLVELDQKAEGEKVFDAYLKAAGSIRIAWLGEPGYATNLTKLSQWGEKYRAYALSIADSLRAATDNSLYEEVYAPILEADFFRLLRRQQLSWDDLMEKANAYIREKQTQFPFVERLVYRTVQHLGIRSQNAETREKAAALALKLIALEWPLEIPDADQRESLADEYNSLAWRFYEEVEDPDKLWSAVLLTRQALAYKPQAWYIWDTLGALYYKLKRKREALEALDRAISLGREQGESDEQGLAETIKLRQAAAALSE